MSFNDDMRAAAKAADSAVKRAMKQYANGYTVTKTTLRAELREPGCAEFKIDYQWN